MFQRRAATVRRYDEEAHAIAPRGVGFDWRDVPRHYVPGEPLATHFYNLMHLLLPVGERMMAGCVAEALPYITDERLREEAIGFIGQEQMHAESHSALHARLAELGIDIEPVLRNVETMLRVMLGDHDLPDPAKRVWLHERLAFYAGMEHFTSIVGEWFLDAEALDEHGMHPGMLDLLRWHGAEEVEHRSVLFDVFQHLDGSYARRARTAVIGSAGLFTATMLGLHALMRQEPDARWWKPWPLAMAGAIRRGLIPGVTFFATEVPVYLRPGFHPSDKGPMDKALQYLATSPAARAADGQVAS